MYKTNITIIAAALIGLTTTASAQTPIKDVPAIRDGIINVGMAYEISRKCDSISARTFRGISFLRSLESYARDLGYSQAQIDAYIDDDEEEDRLKKLARAQLAELGVVRGDDDTYCTVGRTQIAQDTPIGRLLR